MVQIAPHIPVGAGAPVHIRIVSAFAGIHGRYQHKFRRKQIISRIPCNADPPLLHRLAQYFQGSLFKFRQFIQIQHARQTCGTIKK